MRIRRRLIKMESLLSSVPGVITSLDAVVGDILFYDSTNGELIIVDLTLWNAASFPLSRFTPVGLVVIPRSHNIYNNEFCGIMSFRYMNCSTPTTGSIAPQSMCWGSSSDLPITNRTSIVYYNNSTNTISGVINTSSGSPILASDFNLVFYPEYLNDGFLLCAHDTNSAVYNNYLYDVPSPYLTNGSLNSMYRTTSSPSSSANALCDFRGKANTNYMLTARGSKDYTSWTPTYNISSDYPAASCCNMFYTPGTLQGDWYLPALGELGYVAARLGKIHTVTEALNSGYGVTIGLSYIHEGEGYTQYSNFDLISSTEHDTDSYMMFSGISGGYTHMSKIPSGNNYDKPVVRAFLQFSELSLSSYSVSKEKNSGTYTGSIDVYVKGKKHN